MSQEKKFEQKEKSGALWVDNNAQILRKGSMLWKSASPENDNKDEKRYFALVESENNFGKKKLELLMSVGLVFVNENKFSEDSPDISGNVTIDEAIYKFYGRKKEAKDGLPFTSCQLVEKDDEIFVKETEEKLPF